MLQENYTPDDVVEFDESLVATTEAEHSHSSFNIEVELDHLKELILSSTHIPLTELSIVDQDLLLEQLQQIQENLPLELATAVEIVNNRQEIIANAQGYACLIVKSAEEKAHEIVQDSAIVRQAELEGAKIRLRIEQECQQLQQITRNEVDRLRLQAIAECQAIQTDADNYADSVLADLEQRLQQMLAVVQNGRCQLNSESTELKYEQ